ncbi:MAG: TIGR02253 family HAD-type hydrolase [archaeon]|nr:TIGR02253 family HAD-type hydrolase [archaeon]
MAIKAVLFDVDNTLIDFWRMKKEACRAAIEAMISVGLKMSEKDALKLLYELYEIHGIESQRIFQKFTKKVYGKENYKLISHAVIAYRKMRESYLVPYSNVVPTLLELKKRDYKLAIVSDAPIMEAWMRLAALKLDDFFDIIVTKADARKQKTSPAPFKVALRRLGIQANEAIMIGDRIARDVDTAKKLGINTVYARYGDENPPEKGKSGADFEISDVSEILKVLS